MGVLLRLRLLLLAAEGSLLWSVDAQVTHFPHWYSDHLEVSLSDALDFSGHEFHTMLLVWEVSRAAPRAWSPREQTTEPPKPPPSLAGKLEIVYLLPLWYRYGLYGMR